MEETNTDLKSNDISKESRPLRRVVSAADGVQMKEEKSVGFKRIQS